MRSIPVRDSRNYFFVIFSEALGATNGWEALVQYGGVGVNIALPPHST